MHDLYLSVLTKVFQAIQFHFNILILVLDKDTVYYTTWDLTDIQLIIIPGI